MLLGLAIIAVPLLTALVTAAVQMRRLPQTTERLVIQGVQAARLTQDLSSQIASLERTVRLYQVIEDPKLIELYQQHDASLTQTSAQLMRHLRDPEGQRPLQELGRLRTDVLAAMMAAPSRTPTYDDLLQRFDRMDQAAAKLIDRNNVQIDRELVALQQQTQSAQRQLFWESALLLPLTIAAILAFTLGLGRPLRQIDRAIDELGSGAFFRPIRVTGPGDLERLGRQLEWLRLRLLDLAQERNRFLRHMSHELKTPLANIREGTELLMDGAVGELAGGQREVTGILRENGIKLQRMIENLLSFSAWQSNSVGLELTEFRVRPMIKQVIENQQLTLLSQRVRLEVRVEDIVLYADRGKLRLILENLLSNAIKYSPRSGTIFLHAKADGDQFELEVADSGPGIPPEERAHVFDAFYTGKAPSGHVKGTGIGLSVVLEFVTAHGGNVLIVDGERPGAHFRIRMPLRAVQSPPAPVTLESPDDSAGSPPRSTADAA